MRYRRQAILLVGLLAAARLAAGQETAALPAGVKIVWDAAQAQRESTATRERICLNGLWRWQPAQPAASEVPARGWGYFKVPGSWPGITNYMQKDTQTVIAHPAWQNVAISGVTAAWHQREFSVPREWAGRRIALAAEYVNSLATVYLDGRPVGEISFPAGEVDLTDVCPSGEKHVLSLLVVALPLKSVLLSYTDTAAARQAPAVVARRGLCGDVFLVSTPKAARITDVKVDPSVRRGEIAFETALTGLAADSSYTLLGRVASPGESPREFRSPPLTTGDLKEGRFTFTEKWRPAKLWDLHTPQNQCELSLTLVDSQGRTLDVSDPVRFGFREFWIGSRDFYLNGSRIFLSAVPLDNAQVSAAAASYAGARESLERLKAIGVNFVYTHNYGCQPGDHLSFAEILRAADDVGMLVALSQPHFTHYDWQAADADAANGYARHAEFYVRVAQNHPAVVAYSTSHNACGYGEDMNPDMIDGRTDPRSPGEQNNARRALRSEAIIKRFDPSRIVYHHAGGNLGAMHTMNFYPNFVPVQEMSDWFEHWATTGVKPAFTCEYGAPFSWDWGMYRGWYKGERSFGSARVPWEFCLAEWNAQFLGEAAYKIEEPEKANLRWEARQLAAGRLWQRWDYPQNLNLNSKQFTQRDPIVAEYITRNWRAFRTWGVSAISAWEHGQYWDVKSGVERNIRQELPVDWDKLQRPGFSPDFLGQRYERMDMAYERADWTPSAAGQALLRNNQPLLAYIAGKPEAFTSQDHLFVPGETVSKQAIVINNSRQTATCDCTWSLGLPQPLAGSQQVTVATGEQARIPLELALPPSLAPGDYELRAEFKFAGGDAQAYSLAIHVVPRPRALQVSARIALFDPPGQTRAWLSKLGLAFSDVDAAADLSGFDVLIIGKSALTLADGAPDISRVKDGLRVLVFEQTADVLEQRLGLRVTEYGLREVFPRVADHPILKGISKECLHDWRGSATLVPPRLKYELRPRLGPTVQWCGLTVPRLWRCGNRGNVASVLIEKPARGDFLPIVDGGYSLQYSPLLEYREGAGLMLFCQLDVTGRTESDPIADALASNLLEYVAASKPVARREAFYAGDAAGKMHLEAAGISAVPFAAGKLPPSAVLIAGPGSGAVLGEDAAALADWLASGGRLVTVGLSEQDARQVLPQLRLRKAEHIAAFFEPPPFRSPLAGVSPADVHNRDPKELPLVMAGATTVGDGVLAYSEDGRIAVCQLAPWQFGGSQQPNLKKTFRRTSFVLSRLLANQGANSETPLLSRFAAPLAAGSKEQRWLSGLYLDQPEEWDDPYRHFRW